MPTINVAGIGDDPTIEDVVDAYERMRKTLDWLLNGNVDFKNIQAEGITAKNVKAGSIVTDKLAAGAVTADKITVDQLSAITADLGHILAGLIEAVTIIGSEIMTRETGDYPRVALSSMDNMFTATRATGEELQVTPIYSSGPPAILFNTASATRASISLVSSSFGLTTSGTTDLSLQSASDIDLSLNGSLTVNGFTGWSGTFDVVSDVDFVTQDVFYTTVTVKKGIITNVS